MNKENLRRMSKEIDKDHEVESKRLRKLSKYLTKAYEYLRGMEDMSSQANRLVYEMNDITKYIEDLRHSTEENEVGQTWFRRLNQFSRAFVENYREIERLTGKIDKYTDREHNLRAKINKLPNAYTDIKVHTYIEYRKKIHEYSQSILKSVVREVPKFVDRVNQVLKDVEGRIQYEEKRDYARRVHEKKMMVPKILKKQKEAEIRNARGCFYQRLLNFPATEKPDYYECPSIQVSILFITEGFHCGDLVKYYGGFFGRFRKSFQSDPVLTREGYSDIKRMDNMDDFSKVTNIVLSSTLSRSIETAILLFSPRHQVIIAPFIREPGIGYDNSPLPYREQIAKISTNMSQIQNGRTLELLPNYKYVGGPSNKDPRFYYPKSARANMYVVDNRLAQQTSYKMFLNWISGVWPYLVQPKDFKTVLKNRQVNIAVVCHKNFMRKYLGPLGKKAKYNKPIVLNFCWDRIALHKLRQDNCKGKACDYSPIKNDGFDRPNKKFYHTLADDRKLCDFYEKNRVKRRK